MKLKNKHSAIQLAIDANQSGIPAYPIKLDVNEWVVGYDVELLKGEWNDYGRKVQFQYNY